MLRAMFQARLTFPIDAFVESNLELFGADVLFVVYCNGPHCNGADRAAVRLARLGRWVKKMIGGIEGWKDEGFALSTEDVKPLGR
jgi:rhodanese-related sulfurtransferase